MYLTTVMNAEPRALHAIDAARAAIVEEARGTLQRVKSCASMAPRQQADFVAHLEDWISRAPHDAEVAAKLDALDTQIRSVLRHLT